MFFKYRDNIVLCEAHGHWERSMCVIFGSCLLIWVEIVEHDKSCSKMRIIGNKLHRLL